MILGKEAQATLILLSRRKQKDPDLKYWGRSENDGRDWVCLACNEKIKSLEYNYGETPFTHVHGLECLKKHNLLAFI